MVKGHERKAYQPSSSAKAAQLLASTAPKPSGFGFGGFSGATPVGDIAASVSDTQATSSTAEAPALSGELDSEITQLLKSLSKKDAITKIKALQKLKVVVASKEPSTVAACLPAWGYIYNKLVMDNSRATRTEASAVLGAMSKVVGKGLAPFLKPLAGSWWLAQFDLHAEAAAAARDAFQIAFHGPRQKDALLFTRTEVLQLLHDDLIAIPEALGDARKETPEELAERHERVLAGSLLAFSSLLDLLVSVEPQQAVNERDAQSEVVVQLESLLSTQGFLKKMLSFKSEHVRTAAYTLVAHICYRAPQLLAKHMHAAAPLVLGAFQEQQAAAHGAMWEMILSFAKAQPSAWHVVDMRKAVLPRLLIFLRQGCYGSGASSYPAILPYLHLLPKGLLGPDPKILIDILTALWSGLASQMAGKARDAGGDAFSECLSWALSQAEKLAGSPDAAEKFAMQILQASICAQVVPAAIQGTSAIAATASAAITKTVTQIEKQGTPSWLSSTVLQQLGTAVMDILKPLLSSSTTPATPAASVSPFTRVSSLLESLQPAADHKLLLQHVATPVATALVGPVQQGSAPAEASSLLASVVKRFGAEVVVGGASAVLPGGGRTTGGSEAQGLSIETILQSSLGGPLQGSAAQANADLLLSCIQGKSSPAVELAQVLQHLVLMPEGQDQAAGVAAGVSEIMGKAQFDSNEATKQQDDAMPTAGHVFAVLLVQQLLSSLQQASQVLQWQCNELDSLASQLMDLHSTSRPPPTSDQPKTSRSHNQQASLDAAALAEEVAEETLDYDESFSGSEASIPHGPRVFRGGWWEPEPLPVPATFDNAKYQTAQLLGLLIKGRESISLLSDEAVQKTFTQLKAALESSGPGTVQALVTLDSCLYSQAVSAMSSLHQLQHEIVALTFQLSWPVVRIVQAERSYAILAAEEGELPPHSRFDTTSGRAESVDGSDSEEDESYLCAGLRPSATMASKQIREPQDPVHQARIRAAALWQGGTYAAEVYEAATADDQATLQAVLVQRLQSGLRDFCQKAEAEEEAEEEPDRDEVESLFQPSGRHWAALAHEVLTATGSVHQPDALLDALLNPSTGVQGVESRGTVAAGLCYVMGYDAVLFSGAKPRLTTASDILIGCCWNCDHYDEAAALRDYMFQHVCRNGSMQHDPDLSDAVPQLLLHVLRTLSKYADCPDPWKPGQPITLPISSVEVLTKLMRSFETESFPGKLTLLSQWFSNTIASPSFSMHSERFSELMEHATRVLRTSEETVSSSKMDQLAVRLCQRAGAMSPIAAIDHRNTQQLADAMDILSNISDMYIVTESYHGMLSWNLPADREPGGASTSPERKALLALAIKQVQGEGSVARAAAASRRAETSSGVSASADNAARSGTQGMARTCVGRLALCAVIYCHEEMSEQDWRLLLERAQAVVSSAVVYIEDLTEHFAAMTTTAMKRFFQNTPAGQVTPVMAMDFALKVSIRPGAQSKAIKNAAQEVGQDLVKHGHPWHSDRDRHSLHWSVRCDKAHFDDCSISFQILEHLLSRRSSGHPGALDAVPSSIVQEFLQRSYADVLRIVFVVGVLDTIQQALSMSPSCYNGFKSQFNMWTSLDRIAQAAAQDTSMNPVASAAEGIDTWSSETGIDAVTSLIELTFNGFSALSNGAITLLMTPTLLPSITTASAQAEAEEAQNAPAASVGDTYKALLSAGVRPKMAYVLSKPPSREGDYTWFKHLKDYLRVWAVLLAHILEMPLGDPGKTFLAQALRAEYELVPDLFNALVHYLPLKAKAKNTGGKTKAQVASSAATQGKGGKRPGSDQLDLQWNLAKELRHGLTHDMGSVHDDEYQGKELVYPLAAAVFRAALHALPASARAWFGDLRDRGLAASVEAYTAEKESPLLLQQEFQRVQVAPAAPDMDNFSLKANPITREVVAVMEIEDGAVLEMVIKLPASSPLKRAEVTCRRRVGVTEGKLRKWLLSVTAFLANQNGSIAEAITLWQRNVQKEFEGVEECLICYSIVSASDGKLPRLQCKTCSKRFHGSCLYKWFQSSGKSNCPHCQSPW